MPIRSACVLLVLLASVPAGLGLNNGLGKLPGLGWNSDYCDNCTKLNGFQNEKYIKEIADFIHGYPIPFAGGKTFQMLGYHYVNMDASWDSKDRDADGNLVPDPVLWPSGLMNTIDYVHSLGLGFGLYGDRGTKDCAGNPGNLGYETKDADFLAAHEVDWYKTDSCYADQTESVAIAQYEKMRDALNATRRPIWLALCGWQPYFASNPNGGKKLANSARIGPDTAPEGWVSVMNNVLNGASVSNFAGPTEDGGYWNDGSLQLTPGIDHGDAAHYITRERHRSQFSMWSMLAMNILMVGNFSAVGDYVIETWSNEEVLAINQDVLGIPAVIIDHHTRFLQADTGANAYSSDGVAHARHLSGYMQAHVAECGGEPQYQQWLFNSPLTGYFSNPETHQCLNVEACGTTLIYDGCTTTGPSCGGGGGAYHPNEQFYLTAEGQVRSNLTGNPCLTVDVHDNVNVLPCQSPAPASQLWKYSPSANTLVTGNGMCMTSYSPPPPSQPSLTLARPLSGGAFAFLFLNNSPNNMTMTCGSECMAAIHVPDATYTLRDVWKHATIQRNVTPETGFQAFVAANGSSVTLTLSL